MLRKLIKYDIRAVAPVWILMAAVVACMSVFGSVVARLSIEAMDVPGAYSVFYVFGLLFAGLCAVVVVSSPLVTLFLVYWRYYKNFFTDEGYLTFTLPVSRRHLVLSKVINALIWTVAHGVLLTVCLLLACLIVPPTFGEGLFDLYLFEQMGSALRTIFGYGGGWIVVWGLETLVGTVVLLLFSIGCFHLCITIGSMVAKKAKLLVAIGIYYLCNMAISTGTQMFGTLILPQMAPGLEVLLRDASSNEAMGFITLVIAIFIAVLAALTCVIHFVTTGMIERRLNLP